MFDPYHRWLSIPKKHRPPTLYQLLGIAPDEADPEVITEAALRQTSHVRTYQTGPYAAQCTKMLNEIAQARATLLNRARRRDYDSTLGASPPPLPVVTVEPVRLDIVEVERVAAPSRPRGRHPAAYVLLGAGSLLVAQLLLTAAFLLAKALLTRPQE